MQQYQPHDFTLMPVIEQSIHAKHNLVEGDLNDKGMRQMLNFGHSIGHAIESASMQSDFPLLHGEAVMLGMYFESLLSEKIFELTSDISKTLRRVIEMHFAHLNFDYSFTQLSPFLQHDKKNNGDIRMSLLKRVGQGQIQTIVHTALLDEIMPST
jgi:3-dehydroquinate synthase